MSGSGFPGGFDLEAAIARRATDCGIDLPDDVPGRLAAHARAVLQSTDRLHLTSITDPGEFVDRHLGEAFEGAALLEPGVTGALVDLGSGNGYPGIPLSLARPGLVPWLAEASPKRAAFLRGALRAAGLDPATVLERQVQRPAELADLAGVRVLATRAMGGWERILPRLARCLEPDGVVLLWAGAEPGELLHREAWRRYELLRRHPLPGRDRSWIWAFGRSSRA